MFGSRLTRILLVVIVAASGSCGGDEDPAVEAPAGDGAANPAEGDQPGDGAEEELADFQLAVGLDEFSVEIAPQTIDAGGGVEFVVTNQGSTVHQFNIAATDLAPDELPTTDADVVDVGQLTVLEFPNTEIEPGDRQIYSSTFDAGPYVVFCNVMGHYSAGMAAAVEIT